MSRSGCPKRAEADRSGPKGVEGGKLCKNRSVAREAWRDLSYGGRKVAGNGGISAKVVGTLVVSWSGNARIFFGLGRNASVLVRLAGDVRIFAKLGIGIFRCLRRGGDARIFAKLRGDMLGSSRDLEGMLASV